MRQLTISEVKGLDRERRVYFLDFLFFDAPFLWGDGLLEDEESEEELSL